MKAKEHLVYFILLLSLSTIKAADVLGINQRVYLPGDVKENLLLYSEEDENLVFMPNSSFFESGLAQTVYNDLPNFYMALLKNKGKIQPDQKNYKRDENGAIIRINPEERNIYLVFTADSLFEGIDPVYEILKEHQIAGSFFFTGNFLRNREHKKVIKKIIKEGHYVGPHSDKHQLYCDRRNKDSTLITFEEFKTDLENNYKELEKYGIHKDEATFFMPPYEWYNSEIVNWCRKLALDVVNFTPGTGTDADITTPEMDNYKSSEEIWSNLKIFEEYQPEHLNGAILLIHLGTSTNRKDKFYHLLDEIIEYCYTNGYRFSSLKN